MPQKISTQNTEVQSNVCQITSAKYRSMALPNKCIRKRRKRLSHFFFFFYPQDALEISRTWIWGAFWLPANFMSQWTQYRIVHRIQYSKLNWLQTEIDIINSTKPTDLSSNLRLTQSFIGISHLRTPYKSSLQCDKRFTHN